MKEVLAALFFFVVSFVTFSRVSPLASESLASRICAELSAVNIRLDPGMWPSHLYDLFTDCTEPRGMAGKRKPR